MMKKNTKTNKNAVEWYDNPNIITTFIIGLIGLIIQIIWIIILITLGYILMQKSLKMVVVQGG